MPCTQAEPVSLSRAQAKPGSISALQPCLPVSTMEALFIPAVLSKANESGFFSVVFTMNKLFTFVHILDEVIHVSEIEGKTKVYLIYGHTWADSHLQAFHCLDSFLCLLGERDKAALPPSYVVGLEQQSQGTDKREKCTL